MTEPATPAAASASKKHQAPSQWKLVLGLALFLACLFGLTASQLRFGYEGEAIDQAEAILRGTLTPRPQLGGVLPFSKSGIIEVAAYMPFTLLKIIAEKTGTLVGMRQLAYTFAIPFYTVILCLLFYGLNVELYHRPRTAAAATLIFALTTMIWPYSKYGMETHQTLWTIAGLWALIRFGQRESLGAAIALGISAGMLLLTKITGVFIAAALGLAFILELIRLRAWNAPAQAFRRIAWCMFFALIGVAIFLFTNRWRYGGWVWRGRYGIGAELESFPWLEGIYAFLASPNKNVWLYSPTLLVALWFFAKFWRRFPAARGAVVLLTLTAIWQMRNRTWADETWGVRRMHYFLPVMALPLGLWWESRHTLRRWVRGLGQLAVALGVCINLLAVAIDYTAQAKILAPSVMWSQENWVWVPAFNPVTFNMHLLESTLQRTRTGRSSPWIFEHHYLTVTKPTNPPPPVIFRDMKNTDQLDFWFTQQQAAWPGRPYWFHAASSWLAIVMLLVLLASGTWLTYVGRPGGPEFIR